MVKHRLPRREIAGQVPPGVPCTQKREDGIEDVTLGVLPQSAAFGQGGKVPLEALPLRVGKIAWIGGTHALKCNMGWHRWGFLTRAFSGQANYRSASAPAHRIARLNGGLADLFERPEQIREAFCCMCALFDAQRAEGRRLRHRNGTPKLLACCEIESTSLQGLPSVESPGQQPGVARTNASGSIPGGVQTGP